MARNVENKQRVYIIDDDYEISEVISMNLENAQMETKSFHTAEDALAQVRKTGTPELFILDLNLPKMSGFNFLKIIRDEYKPTIPVIIISSNETDDDLIKSIELGADVFVKKPFSARILLAQVKACLKRFSVYSAAVEKSVIFDDYVLLLNSNVLKKGTRKVLLSSIEYGVLEYLVVNAGKPILPEKIYTEIWKAPFGDVTAVAVYIQRLRKKIEVDPTSPVYIKTEFGKGYYFNKEKIFSSQSAENLNQ